MGQTYFRVFLCFRIIPNQKKIILFWLILYGNANGDKLNISFTRELKFFSWIFLKRHLLSNRTDFIVLLISYNLQPRQLLKNKITHSNSKTYCFEQSAAYTFTVIEYLKSKIQPNHKVTCEMIIFVTYHWFNIFGYSYIILIYIERSFHLVNKTNKHC